MAASSCVISISKDEVAKLKSNGVLIDDNEPWNGIIHRVPMKK